MGERLPFVDAHVHLWDLGRISYPWLQPPFAEDGPNGSVEAIAVNYLLGDYLADASGWDVRGIVHVDAGADPAAALDETAWLESVAAESGLPNGIVAFAALDDLQVGSVLAAHKRYRNVRGIRHIANWHPDPARTYTSRDLIRDEAWARGFALLGGYDLSFDLQCYPGQMRRFAALAAKNPETPVIVNHLGMPVPSDPDGITEWRDGMRALAALPQVAVKISGMGFAYRPWTPSQVAPLIRETIDLFGTGRCLIASDFPTDRLFGGFDTTLDAYADITADLSDDERSDIFGRNANRIYRLGLDM